MRTAPLPTVRPADVEGLDAIRLSAGALEATFVPAAGMVGASLRHRGEELLDARDGVRAYVATGATMGIPFLHPWANRLAAERYTAGGRTVELPADLPRDPAGLAIHGLRPAPWTVTMQAAGRHAATVVAVRDVDDPAFPFPHRVAQRITLDAAGLLVETMLRAGPRAAVPVAFGFHPYLRLPGVPREEWIVSLPARRRLVADARLIPTGAGVAEEAETFVLGDRTYDDGYEGLGERPRFSIAGAGRRLTLRFARGYPVAQVYAPPGEDVVCFEPMTARTNALVSGDGLRVVPPRGGFGAAFGIRVE